MFTVAKIEGNNISFLELKNSQGTKAIISLYEGGRLKDLKLNNQYLIKDNVDFPYTESYASSILFPFASRIEGGKYSFKDQEYQLNCNESGKNALHGLVYNKKFILVDKVENSTKCAVTIAYKEEKESAGFPYTYEIYLTYTLSEKGIDLSIKIKNTDTKPYPFTLGWHPYFLCDDLKNSSLKFKSDQQINFDENLITKEVLAYKGDEVFEIKEQQLDDCFILKTNKIGFSTPKYQIEITTNLKENYLQMYTPINQSIIAIEPMTGVSNSFNNKIGLQVLQPNQTYTLTCNVKLTNQ